ncbi:hypothetical protein WK90_10590 [Burkholderia cepacia]|uniref:DUF3304 domain-containing protein n=1 Tax=Burkholderia cepacia TaxID=292 RepID=UPI00075E3AFC|nr:DUF3304 domain-containing protein [Burkholderia cepacia]KVV59961.1 hypothetical protein WK83_12480 [Burkholderia cepacia]KVV60747.1 hypothetical protein WK84_02935 [Burkholderia cepacia]KVV74069.1 hypothetical protein WK86_31490 [Burkholderia cepacia]KVV75385.1 hypothetical protein WK85_11710 [Burkholderia cepacia]KVV82092.1 hypothetical protein WK88_04700 [Burkholderia cepacia]
MSLNAGSTTFAARLLMFMAILLATAGCSRATDVSFAASGVAGGASAPAEPDTLGLKLNALNYTDVPIGAFYVDGTWGGAVPARVGSGGGAIICCVALPKQWHPGLTVNLQWRDDNLYRKDPKALASRVVPVERYDAFSDGFLWVLFFPHDRIKVYASQWMPGYRGFPENLQAPAEACPGHFTLRNGDPQCPNPDKRITR